MNCGDATIEGRGQWAVVVVGGCLDWMILQHLPNLNSMALRLRVNEYLWAEQNAETHRQDSSLCSWRPTVLCFADTISGHLSQ